MSDSNNSLKTGKNPEPEKNYQIPIESNSEISEIAKDYLSYCVDGKKEEEEEKGTEIPKIYYIAMLDAPRELPEPVELTTEHIKDIETELGLIKLCWPEIINVEFENRTDFPQSYLENNRKEKLLLLYAEDFRRQFKYKYPDRKNLL